MIRQLDATTHLGGVTEMVRLSQGVNASSINPSSHGVQWGEFSHSQAKLPYNGKEGRKDHEEDLSSAEAKIMIGQEEVIWEDPSGEELSFVHLSRPDLAGVTKWGTSIEKSWELPFWFGTPPRRK